MAKRKKKWMWLWFALGIPLLCIILLLLWTIWFFTGYRDRGVVGNITDVPHIGYVFADFKADGPVRYVCRFAPPREVACILTGTSSAENVKAFCRPDRGWEMNRESDSAEKIRFSYEYYGVKPEEFPAGTGSEDYYYSNEVRQGHVYLFAEISFRSSDNRFTAWVHRPLFPQIYFPNSIKEATE